MHTTAANVRDDQPVIEMVRSMPAVKRPRGRPRRKPDALYGDRGYGFTWTIAAIVAMGIIAKLAPRGAGHGSGLGKFRYVVERSFAWFDNWRRLRMCYEKCAEHFQAFNELAACLICAKRLSAITAKL